jgi:hypothetical protein
MTGAGAEAEAVSGSVSGTDTEAATEPDLLTRAAPWTRSNSRDVPAAIFGRQLVRVAMPPDARVAPGTGAPGRPALMTRTATPQRLPNFERLRTESSRWVLLVGRASVRFMVSADRAHSGGSACVVAVTVAAVLFGCDASTPDDEATFSEVGAPPGGRGSGSGGGDGGVDASRALPGIDGGASLVGTPDVEGLRVRATAEPSRICPGGCAMLTATVDNGTAPYAFAWSGGLPATAGPHEVCPTESTTYTVTVEDASVDAEFSMRHPPATVNVEVAVEGHDACAVETMGPGSCHFEMGLAEPVGDVWIAGHSIGGAKSEGLEVDVDGGIIVGGRFKGELVAGELTAQSSGDVGAYLAFRQVVPRVPGRSTSR